MKLSEGIRSITWLKNNAAEAVREAHDHGQLTVVTQNGEARAVVMGIRQYEELRETVAMMRLMAQSEAPPESLLDESEAFERANAVLSELTGE